MNTHTTRACRRDAGFSMVELLVTIIIAGIAFAALVPVFVGAQKAASGEQQRNAALGLAQDKLEKVRSLDYDLITQSGLTNDTIPNAQFGTSVSWATGGGGTRTYNVTYQVDLLPVGSTAGSESYKQVTITVAWTGNPQPVKPIVLSTMVSKQYAGPQIVRLAIGPDGVLDDVNGSTVIVSGPVTIDAYIAAEDILSMNQGAIEQNRGYVEFTVTPVNGTSVAAQKVTVPVSGEPNHYTFEWDNYRGDRRRLCLPGRRRRRNRLSRPGDAGEHRPAVHQPCAAAADEPRGQCRRRHAGAAGLDRARLGGR